ncbi:hypothetical protein B566_EDAN011425 [Ephemera danica]|nr:hypothetical protein B566_EDAN011425 [Ephemera danica]
MYVHVLKYVVHKATDSIMGQTASESLPEKIDSVGGEIVRQARHFTELATLSYEDFQKSLRELNALSNECIDSQGRKLVFAVKKGTDTTILWKSTIKIACIRVDVASNKIESFKLLTLGQLLKVAHTLQNHREAAAQSSQQSLGVPPDIFNSSVLLQEVDLIPGETLGENVNHKTCPICREKLDSTEDTWVISEAPGSDEISQEIQDSLLKLSNS